MKRVFWFVLIATVLVALAGTAWLIGAARGSVSRTQRGLLAPWARKPALASLQTQRQPA
jgi:hypothetical protein